MLTVLVLLVCTPIFYFQLLKWSILVKNTDPNWGRVIPLFLICSLIPMVSIQKPLDGTPLQTYFIGVFICVAVSLAIIDAITGYLPDVLTIPLLVAGLVLNFLGRYYLSWDLLNHFWGSIVGCILGYLALYAANRVHLRFTGIDGIGMGDAKLLAAIGSWFGPINLIVVVGIASGLSLVIPLIQWACKQERRAGSAPFGPYIALGAVGALFI